MTDMPETDVRDMALVSVTCVTGVSIRLHVSVFILFSISLILLTLFDEKNANTPYSHDSYTGVSLLVY